MTGKDLVEILTAFTVAITIAALILFFTSMIERKSVG
jgi:hypothetical protein